MLLGCISSAFISRVQQFLYKYWQLVLQGLLDQKMAKIFRMKAACLLLGYLTIDIAFTQLAYIAWRNGPLNYFGLRTLPLNTFRPINELGPFNN